MSRAVKSREHDARGDVAEPGRDLRQERDSHAS
jgi:hypothetical protein